MEDLPLGSDIHQTANCIDRYISNYLSRSPSVELTAMEGITLKVIYRHGGTTTAQEIMKETALSKATTSQTLSALESKKFLEMDPVSSDRRRKMIRLTKKGYEAMKVLDGVFVEIRKNIEKDFSPEERETLRKLLSKVRSNVSIQD